MAGRAHSICQLRFAELEIQVTGGARDCSVFAVERETGEVAMLKVEWVLGRKPSFCGVASATADVDGHIAVRIDKTSLGGRNRRQNN